MALKMVFFGDSMAFGMSDFIGLGQLWGYNPRLAAYAEQDLGQQVELVNLSMGGMTTQNIRDTSYQAEAIEHIQSADIITSDGGGNDWRVARESYHKRTCGSGNGQACMNTMLNEFKGNWNQFGANILQNKKDTCRVFLMCYFQTYVIEDRKLNTYSGDEGNDSLVMRKYIDLMNAHVEAVAGQIPGASYYDLRPDFSPKSLLSIRDPRELGLCGSNDPLHPLSNGHTLIADRLRAQGWGDLAA